MGPQPAWQNDDVFWRGGEEDKSADSAHVVYRIGPSQANLAPRVPQYAAEIKMASEWF